MNSTCRILYLIGQLRTGGQERQLCSLLEGIDRLRYSPAVAVWSFCEDHRYVADVRAMGVPIYPLGQSGNVIAKLRAFRRLVSVLQPEVVHSYSSWTNFAAYWGAQCAHAVSIGSIRADYLYEKNRLGPLLGTVSSYWPHHQIFNSFTAAEKARASKNRFKPRQIHVVRNGLRLDSFRMTPVPRAAKPLILGIGSLLPIKRWDLILLAAASLRRRGLDYLMRIVGDGPMSGLLKKQMVDLGLADRVEFIGHHTNVNDLLAEANFLVLGSDSEGCPNVVMEAMACGRGVVATNVGDVPYLIDNGRTGFVVERGAIPALVDCMARLITDRELCRRMGEAGRARAEREFKLERLASETLDAYRAAGWNG